jgi:predicted ArsR family transcriptional regulator
LPKSHARKTPTPLSRNQRLALMAFALHGELTVDGFWREAKSFVFSEPMARGIIYRLQRRGLLEPAGYDRSTGRAIATFKLSQKGRAEERASLDEIMARMEP